jgi:hypothetical protein
LRAFDITRGTTRYQGIVFDDGAVSVRRMSDDPCHRVTFTFEGESECEAELGLWPSVEVQTESMRAREAAPLGVYAGDGHPLARYAAADNEPEPEDV